MSPMPMSDNLNSDKTPRASRKPAAPANQNAPAYKPTLADQHWRIFLRDKSTAELEEDLQKAIETGNAWRFDLLLQLELDLRNPTDLMELAIEHNRTEMLMRLAAKSDNWKDSYAKDRLADKAAAAGRLDVLTVLIEDYGADIHHYNEELLRSAARGGHLDVVEYLLEKGAKVDAWDHRALRDACENGHLEVVKRLLKAGADINADDGEPLNEAARGNHVKLVEFLLKKGADPALDDYGVLEKAANDEAQDTLKLLLDKVGDKAPGEAKSKAFSEAVRNEHFVAAKMLLDAGADVNTDHGRALRAAAWRGENKAIEFLLADGANPNVHEHRETPLSEAVSAGHLRSVVLLAEGGADPAYLQNEAMEVAKRRERPEMLEAMAAGVVVAQKKYARVKGEEFGAAFTGDYSLDDLRTRKGSSGDTGLMLAAQTGHFADIVRGAKGGAQPRLTAQDLFHPDDRVDTVLALLLRNDTLQQFFSTDFWADRKDELLEAYRQLPEDLRKGVDLGGIAAEINYRELLKKAQNKKGPPRLGK
ncbi:MAG: hypothetical protein GC185_07835 [Alphaproteobacteria bacterium]|nr:hypothetical protein [Alphaproteobacteria bacterium]